MKLASLKSRDQDGRLIVVSRDLNRAADAAAICPTLQAALDNWENVVSDLRSLSLRLDDGYASDSFPFDPAAVLSPLPRPPQWLDASAFQSHGALMARAFGFDEPHWNAIPLMYQGLSSYTLAPTEDAYLPSEADGIDFEGEFAVVVADTPMGVSVDEAEGFIRLVMLANDWSLRAMAPREMKTGFGFIQAKPATAFSPVAVTLDELGSAWHNGRVKLPFTTRLNGEWFGAPRGDEMAFSFPELIAHAAYSRRLSAGTIIGSGTVSNFDYRTNGASCIAERRMAEIVENGAATTMFMKSGDRVRMEVDGINGKSVFGAIDQRAVCDK